MRGFSARETDAIDKAMHRVNGCRVLLMKIFHPLVCWGLFLASIFAFQGPALGQDSGIVYNLRITYSSMTFNPVQNAATNIRGADSGYIVLGPEETMLVSDTVYDGSTGEPQVSTREVRVRGYATIYVYTSRVGSGWLRQFQVFYVPPAQEMEAGEYWISGDWAYHDVVQIDPAGRRLTAVLAPNRSTALTGRAVRGKPARTSEPTLFARVLGASSTDVRIAGDPGAPLAEQPVRGIQTANSTLLTVNPVLTTLIQGAPMDEAMDRILADLVAKGYEQL